jgi:16S rRNA processing protein RimM
MDNKLIETGKIINTHGIRGEVKIDPWANSPAELLDYETFYIDEKPYGVIKARVQKKFVIAALEGVSSIEEAEKLKNKVIYISRDEMELEDGEYLLNDLIGLEAIDNDSGKSLGKITDILTPPGGEVFEIRGEREILIPMRPEFLIDVDTDAGKVSFHLIEGM